MVVTFVELKSSNKVTCMDIKIKIGMIAPCLVNIEQWGIKAFIKNERIRCGHVQNVAE